MKAGSHYQLHTRRPEILFIVCLLQCSFAWVQRGVNFHSPHHSFSARHQHPILSNRKRSIRLYVNDDVSLDLYKTVAEQDPEWYREFVVNVLGGDLVETNHDVVPKNDLALSIKAERKDGNHTRLASESPEITNLSKSSPILEEHSDESTLKVASHGENAPQVEKLQMTDKYNTTARSVFQIPNYLKTQPAVTLDAPIPEPVLDPSQMDVEISSTDPVAPDPTGVTGPRKKSSKTWDTLNNAEEEETKTASPNSEGTETRDSSKLSAKYDGSEEELAPERPLVGGCELDGRISPTGSKATSDTKTHATPKATSKEKGGKTHSTPPEVAHYTPQSDRFGSPMSSNLVSQSIEQMTEIKGKERNAKAQTWFDISPRKSPLSKKMPERDDLDRVLSAVESNSSKTVVRRVKSDGSKYVVLYRDLYTGDLRAENLTSVTFLGYNESEIPYLQPDALALIIEDEIRKPSRGIPQQWQISQSQYEVLSDDVRIVPHEEAKELLEAGNGKKRSASKEPQYSTRLKNDPSGHNENGNYSKSAHGDKKPFSEGTRPERAERQGSTTSTVKERRRRRRPEKKPVSTSMRSYPRLDKKRIYNARELPKKSARLEHDDPPPPDSPLWVDMDTFRDLLRSEAELRVRILGKDWADVVKDESNWRLSLYKEWLWVLNRGIGNPLVPSRSDWARARSQFREATLEMKGNEKPQRRFYTNVQDQTRRHKRPYRNASDEKDDVNGKVGDIYPKRERNIVGDQVPKRRKLHHKSESTDSITRETRQTEPMSHQKRAKFRRDDDSTAYPSRTRSQHLGRNSTRRMAINKDETDMFK